MGQIASIFDPNERRRDEELEYIDEEDEYVNSVTQTPCEEEDEDDESTFKDCEEESDVEEEENSEEENSEYDEEYEDKDVTKKQGSRAIACFLGNYQEETEEEEEEEYDVSLMEEVNKLSKAENICTESERVEEDKKSVHSQGSEHNESVLEEKIPPLTEAEVVKIIEDLMRGDYDDNILALWNVVDSTQYEFEDSSYSYLLPVLVLCKLVTKYFEEGGTDVKEVMDFLSLLQNFISEWINLNQGESNTLVLNHSNIIQYLYNSIQNIVYLLNMVNQVDLASRFSWILDYITIDRIDPVTMIQTRMKDGSYQKKYGSLYDSSNGDTTLFAMLSPSSVESEAVESRPLPVNSPSLKRTSHSMDVTHDPQEIDSWRHKPQRSSGSYSHNDSYRGNRNKGQRGRNTGSPSNSLRRTNSQKDRSRSLHSLSSHPSFNRSHNRNTSEQLNRSGNHSNNSSYSHLRELQRWNSQNDDDMNCLSLEEMHQLEGSGSTSWDQFSLNKEKFGIDSHFNEDLYTIPMSSLQINKDEWEEAVSAAREIERNESERETLDDSALYSDVVAIKDKKKGRFPQNHGDSFTDSAIRKK